MTAKPPANWYVDPTNPSIVRYWDGNQWTTQTAANPSAHTASRPHVPEPPVRESGGFFGARKSLEAERDELRRFVDAFGYAERDALAKQIAALHAEEAAARQKLIALTGELWDLDAKVVKTRDEEILQEVGLYDFRHRLEDSVAYKDRIESVRARQKEMCKKDGGAVTGTTKWELNGSEKQGKKMVSDISKLLLRAYNGEADDLVARMKPYKLEASVAQLNKARAAISKLGAVMTIDVTDDYHKLRIEELELTADYLAKKADEKEREREERELLREQEQARKDFEAKKAELLKEQAHYQAALEKLRVAGSQEEVAAAEAKLLEVAGAIAGVDERAANVRAGYVYVISNVGAFGEGVLKVGMTRRLDPLDRVKELGDASVPFKFDVHAVVFSDDAVTLESRLHQALAAQRVNLVNQRREFFFTTPAEVRDLIIGFGGSVLEFSETAEASEWHQSENERTTRAE